MHISHRVAPSGLAPSASAPFLRRHIDLARTASAMCRPCPSTCG